MGMNRYITPRREKRDDRRQKRDSRFLFFFCLLSVFCCLSSVVSWADEKRVVNEEMGIMVATITEEYKQDLNLDNANGVIVLGVLPGGPADEGGIHPGDVILGIAGFDINNIEEYEAALKKLKGKMDFNIMVRGRDGLFSFIQIISRGD